MFSLHIDTARGWRGGQSQVLHTVVGLRAIGERAALVVHPEGELRRRMSEGLDLIPIATRGEVDLSAAWKLSRVIYGRGVNYTVIYSANKEQIRDPDLIYPGQIFAIPNAEPPETIDPKRREPLSSAVSGTFRSLSRSSTDDPPRQATGERKRLGVVATLVWDRIVNRDGRSVPIEEWGGAAYALSALGASLPETWTIVPILKVGRDLAEDAFRVGESDRLTRLEMNRAVAVHEGPLGDRDTEHAHRALDRPCAVETARIDAREPGRVLAGSEPESAGSDAGLLRDPAADEPAFLVTDFHAVALHVGRRGPLERAERRVTRVRERDRRRFERAR